MPLRWKDDDEPADAQMPPFGVAIAYTMIVIGLGIMAADALQWVRAWLK